MSVQTEELSVDLLEQVLSKLGFADRPAPTLDGLQRVYAAWCRKVPFDNIRKLIHLHSHDPSPLPGDARIKIFRSIYRCL
jgi:N-hydroxyarylamine O-acetyltransferase